MPTKPGFAPGKPGTCCAEGMRRAPDSYHTGTRCSRAIARRPLRGQLLQRGGDEHPHPLIRRENDPRLLAQLMPHRWVGASAESGLIRQVFAAIERHGATVRRFAV